MESAKDAVQFLLTLFESWTFTSLPQLPSIRNSGSAIPPLDNPHVPETATHAPVPAFCDVASLRGIVRQLVDLCHGQPK